MIGNRCQNGSKKEPKSSPKTIGDLIFETLGRFGRMLFFDDFLERKKSPNIWKNPILWAEMGAKTSKMARPGGMRGASGEVRRG